MTKHESKPVLLIDTREKTPWQFENDDAFESIKHKKLDGGDYSIEGMEHILAIERKATIDELFINFTKDRERIKAEFERLREHRFKFVIIEDSLDNLMNPYRYYINKKHINKQNPKMPVAVVSSNLTDLMLKENVSVIFAGQKAQSIARGILLKAYELFMDKKL